MTRQEYFTSIVKTLSTRAVKIIEKLNITPENIGSFTAAYFGRVHNCGKKTQHELAFLCQCMSKFSSQKSTQIESSQNEKVFFEEQITSFNLSCRARNALTGLEIRDFASLQKEAINNFAALHSMRNIGKKSLMEIQDFYDYFCHVLHLVENEKIESTPKLQEPTAEYKAYLEIESPYLDKLLTDIYSKELDGLSAYEKKIISYNCANFVELISANLASINIADSNQERRDVIASIIFAFRDKFLLEASPYLEMSREDLWWHEYFSDKKFIRPEDRMFIRQFKEKENHLPFWFIINQILFKPPQSIHVRDYLFFCAYLGLSGEKKSPQEIMQEFSTSFNCVRTGIIRFSKYIKNRSGKEEELLRVYPFLRNDFLTVENTNFRELSAKEHLQFDFDVFCHICSFLIKKLIPMDFYSNNGKIVTGCSPSYNYDPRSLNSRSEHLYACIYNIDLSSFNFARMMQRIKRSLGKYIGNYIVISDLCKDIDLWNDRKIKQDLIARIVPMVEHLTSVLFQVECSNGLICVKNIQYKTDSPSRIKQVLYNCLAASNKPLSLVELFEAYRKECSDSALTKPQQLKNAIYQSDQIIAIGSKSLYTIKERLDPQAFQGSLYDCIEKVLIDSGKPLKKDEVTAAALKIRPDSTPKSIRSIIASMLRSDRLKLYNNEYIGLPRKKYGHSFIITEPEYRLTFEERMMQMYDFVAANGRLPFTTGTSEEVSLALWYSRTLKSTSLTTQQMVDLYDFKQAAIEAKIPLIAAHESFQKNCLEFRTIVMRKGQIPRANEHKRLAEWFQRSCKRYSELDDFSKHYFDELVSFLSAFGYKIELE